MSVCRLSLFNGLELSFNKIPSSSGSKMSRNLYDHGVVRNDDDLRNLPLCLDTSRTPANAVKAESGPAETGTPDLRFLRLFINKSCQAEV